MTIFCLFTATTYCDGLGGRNLLFYYLPFLLAIIYTWIWELEKDVPGAKYLAGARSHVLFTLLILQDTKRGYYTADLEHYAPVGRFEGVGRDDGSDWPICIEGMRCV